MLRRYVADLHVHTVLSPCAEYRMVPELIVERSRRVGINLLGITDHNSGENAGAVISAAAGSEIEVLPGMEVESREGVHLLTLFDDIDTLVSWQDDIYRALPKRNNAEGIFGVQLVVDVDGSLLGVNRRLLVTATNISVEEVAKGAARAGGICIPAHVDRPAYGLLGVLGLIPAGLEVEAMEVSANHTPTSARHHFSELAGRTLIQSSDAHSLEDIGKVSTSFLMARASVQELYMACKGAQGRTVI